LKRRESFLGQGKCINLKKNDQTFEYILVACVDERKGAISCANGGVILALKSRTWSLLAIADQVVAKFSFRSVQH